ncbi:MAG: N-acetylmuramoyl-L-alanine amidase [Prosthecobacter sp.]|uniref:N-acetylmuramoyl-L-alanine amidase n=1 Tax=Prosthecobacter sp. TaxID=1965333 RepID=UPI0025DEEF7F|nr:N-acetylmuramoyl-L-alanine amidase [Prosthecobacter sp.]MCF7786697.1 N-acetylmuramoyl-L-alanine amidase [Prosthecobacter sp.]
MHHLSSRIAAWCLALIVGGAAFVVGAESVRFSTVVIDAGHGGKDGGSVWNGLVEKKLCLDVAKRVETALKSRGLKTVMTRRTDTFVELEQRARIANRVPSSIFVSIHFNGSRTTIISGGEVYYRSSRGKLLASAISRSIKSKVAGGTRGIFHGVFKVLRETRMPAVLVECGYISNKREALRCADPSHRQKLADAIVSGLLAVRRKE